MFERGFSRTILWFCFFIARIGGEFMDINTFQLKMLGKSLLKLTLIMMAASAFIDKIQDPHEKIPAESA